MKLCCTLEWQDLNILKIINKVRLRLLFVIILLSQAFDLARKKKACYTQVYMSTSSTLFLETFSVLGNWKRLFAMQHFGFDYAVFSFGIPGICYWTFLLSLQFFMAKFKTKWIVSINICCYFFTDFSRSILHFICLHVLVQIWQKWPIQSAILISLL